VVQDPNGRCPQRDRIFASRSHPVKQVSQVAETVLASSTHVLRTWLGQMVGFSKCSPRFTALLLAAGLAMNGTEVGASSFHLSASGAVDRHNIEPLYAGSGEGQSKGSLLAWTKRADLRACSLDHRADIIKKLRADFHP